MEGFAMCRSLEAGRSSTSLRSTACVCMPGLVDRPKDEIVVCFETGGRALAGFARVLSLGMLGMDDGLKLLVNQLAK